jgi:hypothetical protein
MVRSGSRALGVDPLQSLHFLPAARCVGTGSGFLEVLRPFDDVTRASPMVRRTVRSRRGSALRFSQPLSGFLACPGCAALFHAAAARGVLPSERCSSLGIACASRRRLLPCSSTRSYLRRMHATASPGFHRLPRSWRGGLDPHRSSDTVSTARLPTLSREGLPRLSRHPGPRAPDTSFRPLRLLRSFAPPASPRARRVPFGTAPWPVLSWALPLQSLESDRASAPRMTQRTIPSAALLVAR